MLFLHGRAGGIHTLGMPLYANNERGGAVFQSLDHAVGGEGGDLKALTDRLNALMMETISVYEISANII